MPKPQDKWTVLPHGAPNEIMPGILTVVGEIPMPLGKFPRRMTVVGLSGKRSAIFSAISLGEPAMRRIEELGKPSFLIVPNGHHRLDAGAWKHRYPDIVVLCPPAAKKSVGETVAVDSTTDILNDKDTEFTTVGGTGEGEAAMIVRRKTGATLIVNDVIANVRHPRGIGSKIITRLAGFGAKGPQVPRVVKRVMVADKAALAAQLRSWAEIPNLARILPSHGEIIDRPAAVLGRLADDLDGGSDS